ncbi:hypothetical protein U0070_017444, partial [Myodes glareolus]
MGDEKAGQKRRWYKKIKTLCCLEQLILNLECIKTLHVKMPTSRSYGCEYWSHRFNSPCHPNQLREFIVMGCSTVQDLLCS